MKKVINPELDPNDDNNIIYWGNDNHVVINDVNLSNKDLLLNNRFDFGNEAPNRFINTKEIKKPRRFKFNQDEEFKK